MEDSSKIGCNFGVGAACLLATANADQECQLLATLRMCNANTCEAAETPVSKKLRMSQACGSELLASTQRDHNF